MAESGSRKKRKENAEAEHSERFSEIEVDTSRSKNSPVAIGHHITQNIEAPQEPIDVHPYEPNDLSLIGIGKRLMRIFYGTSNHDLTWWTIGAVISSILSGGTVGAPFVPGTPVPVGSQYYVPLSLVGFIGLALTALLGWGPIGMAKQTECPKCHYKFTFFDVRKTLVNTAELSDKEVRNYRVKRVCDQCGYSTTIRKVEHVPYGPQDEDDSEEAF